MERAKDHCPMGECLGCQYAPDCPHQALQAERLRSEVERLKRERDTTMNVAAGVAAEREAAYEAVTRANNARRAARSAAMEEAAQRLDERGFREAACVIRAAAKEKA